jgi:hypothetical protein
MATMADLGHDSHRLGLGAPADGEGAGDRPALDSGGKNRRFAGSHLKIWQFLNRRLARRYQVWLVRDMFYKAAAGWMFPCGTSRDSAGVLAS